MFGSPKVDLETIINSVSEFDIVAHYFNVVNIPCFIKSPLRKDNKPSFGFNYNGKNIRWKDMATGERGGIYDLLSKLWGLKYNEVLYKIYKDIYEGNKGNKEIHINSADSCRTAKVNYADSTINVKRREWEQHDLEYWREFGITKEWLEFADIYPISHKIVTKNGRTYTFAAEKYAYAYVEFKEGKTTIKIYQPLVKDKSKKWFNKHDRSVISLWTKIPKEGKAVCICSSVKDALCLWSNTGLPAIATQGEGYTMSDTAIAELKRRFENIFVLFDNDEAGIKDGIILSEATGFTDVILPQFEGGKDVSDLYKIKGKEFFLKTIKKLFTNYLKQYQHD